MILLDIEGTTTPIAFVTQVLYPYARSHLHSYLYDRGDSPRNRELLAALRQEHAKDQAAGEPVPPWADPDADARPSAQAYLEWLMDRDRKSPALKEVQGDIWEGGYQRNELVGEVYEDVPRAFRRWRSGGERLGIFSSGAVLAQRCLFRRSSAGDLSPFLDRYFDTHVGAKRDPESYRRIAADVDESPAQVRFVSDVAGELDAARAAGLSTIMIVRPGNLPQPPHAHPVVHSFDEI